MWYHRLIYDSDREDLSVINKYELDGFNLTSLWKGVEVEPFPEGLRLIVDDSENELLGDLVGNPISWFVCSQQLQDFLGVSSRSDELQLLAAPMFRKSNNTRIDGYVVLNPLLKIGCLDSDKSVLSRTSSGVISSIDECVLKESSIPKGTALFRLEEFPKAIFVSDEIANSLRHQGIRGVAFIRCKAV